MYPVSAKVALELLEGNDAFAGLDVQGRLSWHHKADWATRLPEQLRVTALDLRSCTDLKTLPAGLQCYELNLANTGIELLPPDLKVEYRLDLSNCHLLHELPADFSVGSLILRNCSTLKALPDNLSVNFLDISGCVNLVDFPECVSIQHGSLVATGCTRLINLPPHASLSVLDIEGCPNITALPDDLSVTARINVAGSGLKALPDRLKDIDIYWREVPVSYDIAFQPESITAEAVMDESNVEIRRVMLEQMGYERFIEQSHAEELDRDYDQGGVRRLICIELPADEPLVCVTYYCPSTARQFVTRVPPHMQTCRQAVAWIGGFNNPDDYQLIEEA